jgi:hypothetical protein
MLRLNPAFSFTVILTLALGIGATTAIFSVVNGIVIKPLAYPDADEVVTVGQSVLIGGVRDNNFPTSPQHLEVYLATQRAFEQIGLIRGGAAAVTGSGDPEQATTLLVTAGAMRAFGVRPTLGRGLSNDDDRPSAAQTTILGDGYWRRRFGGDPSVIGRAITGDGTPREVIGVMPPGFNYRGNLADLILPLQLDLAQPRADFAYTTVARLKPGVTVADANADLGRVLPIYVEKYMPPEPAAALQLQPAVRPLKERRRGQHRRGAGLRRSADSARDRAGESAAVERGHDRSAGARLCGPARAFRRRADLADAQSGSVWVRARERRRAAVDPPP